MLLYNNKQLTSLSDRSVIQNEAAVLPAESGHTKKGCRARRRCGAKLKNALTPHSKQPGAEPRPSGASRPSKSRSKQAAAVATARPAAPPSQPASQAASPGVRRHQRPLAVEWHPRMKSGSAFHLAVVRSHCSQRSSTITLGSFERIHKRAFDEL